MKGLFIEKINCFKAMAVVVCYLLAACGSGGGGLDLGDGGNGGCDTTPVTIQTTNGVITSKDGMATLRIVLQTPVNASLSVNCTRSSGQVGNAYLLVVDQSSATIQLEISYAGIDLGGTSEATLELKEFADSITGWLSVQGAVPNPDTDTFTLGNPLTSLYAIFAPTGGGGGEDTTAPSQPTGVILSVNGGTITIRWNASQDNLEGTGVKGYDVFRGIGADAELSLTQLTPSPPGSITQTLYNDSPPGVGSTRYCYAVRAVDNAGNTSPLSVTRCYPI